MTINLKRRDGVLQSASLLSTRTVTSWLGVWKPVDFERKYLLEKVNRSNNGFEITNLTFISFGNNLCCRRINRYSSKVSSLITLCLDVYRCPAAEHDFQTTPFQQSDNFSFSGLFTRNSRFIQRHLCSHR